MLIHGLKDPAAIEGTQVLEILQALSEIRIS
jgi:hypothetical protein